MTHFRNYSLGVIALLLVISGCRNRIATSRKSRHAKEQATDAGVPMKGIKHTNLDEALRCKISTKNQGDDELAAKDTSNTL